MTLDEAIKHAEEVAEENEKSLRGWKECINRGTVGWSDFDKEKVDASITRCSKCAAEHRQLAEWLKDYKRLLEQEPCDGAISRQAAIEALQEVSEHYTEKGRDWHPHVNFMVDAIKGLPPVTPQLKQEPCDDTINR